MHLKELRLVVETRGVCTKGQENAQHRLARRSRDPETILYSLGSIVGQIVNTGVLRGFIDKIQLSTGDKILNWSPEDKEGSGIPECWNGYGFSWGMDMYQE